MPLNKETKSIWRIDWIRAGTTIPGQNGPGSNGHEDVI